MNENVLLLFLGCVFLTVFLLSQVLILPTFGTDSAQRKKLKNRFDKLLLDRGEAQQQLIKKKHLEKLSPIARWLESKKLMIVIKLFLEQAGKPTLPAYKFLLGNLIMSSAAGFLVWKYFHNPVTALATAVAAFYLVFFWLQKKRNKNLEKFEEQLPEALEMIARSIRTGYPFSESLRIVSEEMTVPISREFGLLFEEINYGRDLEIAFALMMERVPSLSLSAMATSILIQKETGGNLAEILLKISAVLRGRFKLQRKIKTLSAEGVFAAWVLCLMPFVMFVMFNLINPDHFKALYENPHGIRLFYAIGILEVIAIFWMRKIVNIDA
jgi:tight adherence protein B